MKLADFREVNYTNKRVLVRVDFNVTLRDGDVREKFKVASCKETLDFLLQFSGVKVALLSHLGRPDGRVHADLSLEQLTDDIGRILGIEANFVNDCVGEKVANGLDNLEDGKVLLLENVRFYQEEKDNDFVFAQRLSENFDIFINDAFSVCHRNQSSVTGITQHLPSYAGARLMREVETLAQIWENPQHPAVAVIGGAKIQTKMPLIRAFEKRFDTILVGGRVANEAIDMEKTFSDKVFLPIDFPDDRRLDIGPKTVALFQEKLQGARTIIWNGPLGKFEDAKWSRGTFAIARSIVQSGAFSVIGGGESVEVLESQNILDAVGFVSTGGGAMLEFLSGGSMPGVDVLSIN